MSNTQGTLVQKWGRGLTLGFTLGVVLLHVAAYAVAAYFCPQLFITQTYKVPKGRHDKHNASLSTSCPGRPLPA